MSDKTYIGNKAGKLDDKGTLPPISRVTLFVDDENYYTAGDDTGRELKKTNPHATQAMADSILSAVAGYQHRPYRAQSALLDPAAELGDGVTIGGLYSQIGYTVVDFGPAYTVEVSAPGGNEIDEEFGSYLSQEQREYNRQLAQTRSLITKTSEQIRMEVAEEMGDLSSSFTVELESITARVQGAEESIEVTLTTLDGLTVTDGTGTTRIKGSSIETDTLYVNAANITGTLTADQINLSGAITWNDLASGVQSNINGAYSAASNAQSTANSASSTASNAYNLAYSANTTVNSWCYSGTTYIDGTMIMTGTVKASTLQGGTIGILNSYGTQIGYMSVGSSTSAGLQLVSGGNLYLSSASCHIQMSGSDMSVVCSYLYPTGSAPYLGHSSKGMWQAVYAYTSTIQTSDRNLKHDIEDLPDKYLYMLLSLHPRRYKMNNGTSDRYHVGFIAQEVEEAMELYEIDSLEFAGFIKDVDTEGNEIYMLRYEEFIAIHTLAVQRIYQRLEMAGI